MITDEEARELMDTITTNAELLEEFCDSRDDCKGCPLHHGYLCELVD